MRQRRKRSEQAAGETLFLARAPARRDAEAVPPDTYARVRTRVTARRTRPHAAHVTAVRVLGTLHTDTDSYKQVVGQ